MGNSLCIQAGDSLIIGDVKNNKAQNLQSKLWDSTVAETLADSNASASIVSTSNVPQPKKAIHQSILELTVPTLDPVPRPTQCIDSCKMEGHRYSFLGGIKYKHNFPLDTHVSDSERIFNEAARSKIPIILVSWHQSTQHLPLSDKVFDEVLKNPLIIEAAETLFLPIVVTEELDSLCKQFENMGGFVHLNESWINGPCVRIIAGFRNPIKEPERFVLNSEWSPSSMAFSMSAALKVLGRPVPNFLQILEKEKFDSFILGNKVFSTRRVVYLTLNQFDHGEVFFADIDGVISLRSGRIDGYKVIQIAYDSRRISFSEIVEETIRRQMTRKIYYENNDERIAAMSKLNHDSHFQICRLTKFVEDKDSKQALRKTALRCVPLTDMQCALVNKLIFEGKFNEAMHLLSPRQGIILSRLFRSKHDGIFEAVDVPIYCAWSELMNFGFFDTK